MSIKRNNKNKITANVIQTNGKHTIVSPSLHPNDLNLFCLSQYIIDGLNTSKSDTNIK